MSDVELSGIVAGVGSVPALTPIKIAVTSALAGGLSGIAALTFNRTSLFGAQTYGFGELGDHLAISLTGELQGQGDAQASLLRVLPMSGVDSGLGRLYESVLEPARGYGDIQCYLDVSRVPCPVSCTLPGGPVFRWGQEFGPGELMIAFTDTMGNPFAPVVVLFRLFRVVSNGVLYPVGPFNRRPVACHRRLGVYYVTGTAGETGQPGDWVIEWRWQRSPFTPTQVERRPFKVLDAVLDTSVSDSTSRCVKYGWD